MNQLYEIATKVNTLFSFYVIIGLFINVLVFMIKELVTLIVKKVQAFMEKRKHDKGELEQTKETTEE